MGNGAAVTRRAPDAAGLLFQAIWDSHVHEMRAALAHERGEKIARVAASGIEFAGSALNSIWAVEAKHLEALARRSAADFEQRAPRKYLSPKRLPLVMEAATTALRKEAQGALCQTPMQGAEDSRRAGEFRNRILLHLEGVIEAQLRAAVHTTEANKEPLWKRVFSAVFELVKLVRP